MWGNSRRTLSTRIVSYNVLSSSLAPPSQFPSYPVEHLDASNRLAVVLKKLELELKGGGQKQQANNNSVIFCLQEVSHDWAGALHTFFSNHGYYMTTGLYGRKFNGYMGVCLAWPMEQLETVDVKIATLSDVRPDGWPKDPVEHGVCWNAIQSIQSSVRRVLNKIRNKKDPLDYWYESQRRSNIVLTATLRDKHTKQAFVVATYHMPCAFYAPPVMTVHSDLAAYYTQQVAAEQGNLPCVLAGDFNIKPGDVPYQFLTRSEDQVTWEENSRPPTKFGVEWSLLRPEPMRSAYADHLQTEPDFTNYAQTRDNEPFIDTLDYIFISKEWVVDDVLKLPHRHDAKGPYPNLDVDEPSDHVLISANLTIKL
jgi:mRNA deadenylase 3'-5' endonuclease subunit Ccr4